MGKNRVKAVLWLKNLLASTTIEYGLIVAAISVGILAIVFTVGDDLANIFQAFATRIESVL